MKNKFILLMGEAAALAVIAVIILNNILEGDIKYTVSIVIIFISIILAVTVQGCAVLEEYNKKIKELEDVAKESRETEMIRREFVANVSHELKTPLTSISGFIETLQDGAIEDSEIRNKFIDIIAIETARLKRLIEDLLVLSDIENRRDSAGIDFDVKAALISTAEALKPISEAKGINIISEIEDDLIIKGSIDRFKQMMVNLIENAIKYSDEGNCVWIRAARSNEGIVVTIEDEGIGIAPEHHERLFERFYRVDKSRSKKVGGTGLGLSIVKHIAVLFGASLKVESQVGKGTIFYVIFKE